MLRKRIEKLEAHLPEPAGKLRERIERQSLNALCPRDRELVFEVFRTKGRRKVWSPAHDAAIERYREFFGHLLESVSEKDLIAMRLQIEHERGKSIREVVGVA
jgi:hypothetical protein